MSVSAAKIRRAREVKANGFLSKFLTKKQQRQYIQEGQVTVVGSDGCIFVIPERAGRGNDNGFKTYATVHKYNRKGTYLMSYCIGLSTIDAWSINLLALKMALERDGYRLIQRTGGVHSYYFAYMFQLDIERLPI